jgi:hypothetical protein
MRYRWVVYTLTQFSTVKSVVFQIEGETVTVFGSEGIVLDGPVGRADYYDQLPSIFVIGRHTAPRSQSGKVTGNASVFRRVASRSSTRPEDAVDEPVMASCGTGCRGVRGP